MKKALWLLMAGVAIGLLVAPDRGSETWKKITGRLNDIKDKAKRSVDDLAENGKGMARKGKEGIGELTKEW